jgi:hypothetical protein
MPNSSDYLRNDALCIGATPNHFSKGSQSSSLPLGMKSKRELHNTHQLNKGQGKKKEKEMTDLERKWRQHGLFDPRIL